MSGRYAANTEVPVDRSKSEIESILVRYGADQFMYGWGQDGAIVGFRLNSRMIRIKLPLPSRDDPQFQMTETGRYRKSKDAMQTAYEQAVRQKWRALALVIKAKLEAIEAGISTLEDEFLANVLLPDGTTAGEFMQPQIKSVYQTGKMPAMLPGLPGNVVGLLEGPK
jgi:hypothetical protein